MVAAALLAGCAARRRVYPPVPAAPVAERVVPASDLIKAVNAWGKQIETLTATVRLTASGGSGASRALKRRHAIRGYILFKKPAWIRMIGQAPVVGTDIFDMASNGEHFTLLLPTKHEMFEGANHYRGSAKNSLENIRPQHIIEALVVPPMAASGDRYFIEQAERDGQSYEVLGVLRGSGSGSLLLLRKIWFDVATLQIRRVEIFKSGGRLLEDVAYDRYQTFQGAHYPSRITILRPQEDYSLEIRFERVTFNTPITSDKFVVKKPEGYKVIELGQKETTG